MSTTTLFTTFGLVVAVLLVLDLFVAHRRVQVVSVASAAVWSVIWIIAGLAFGGATMSAYGGADALSAYFTVYLVEKSLSIDNVFLWLLVFSALAVPRALQRRVLLYGVLGAIVMRTAAIYAGTAVVERFVFVLYLAGGFLIYAGIQLWRRRHEKDETLEDPRILRVLHRFIPTTDDYRGQRFVVRENGRWMATPMLTVLLLIELTDLVLALDALPAALTITTDAAIIVTANVFALLGLRSLYFLVAGVAERLHYLKAGVAVILVYIGATLLIEHTLGAYHPSTLQSLAVIVFVLAAAVWASLWRDRALALGAEQDEHPNC